MNPKQPDEKPLQSWKEIAGYLERDIRTAIRWEKREGLPVRRHTAGKRSSVFAYRSELDAWRDVRQPRAKAGQQGRPLWTTLVYSMMGAAALAMLAILLFHRFILNPPTPLSEAAQDLVTARQIWAGPDTELSGVSLDGRFLTFNDQDGNLAIRDLKTGQHRALTDTNWQDEPHEYAARGSAISPDGSQVAFAWINQRREPRVQIRVGPLTESSVTFSSRTIYEAQGIVYAIPTAWFPSGRDLFALLIGRDRSVTHASLSIETGALHVLTSFPKGGGDPRRAHLSPKGDYILYDRFPDQDARTRDLYLVSTEGRTEKTLVEHLADDRAFGWTPDGRGVLFASDRSGNLDLYTLSVEGGMADGPPVMLKRNLGRAQPLGVARDGSVYYALSSGSNHLYSLTLDATDERPASDPVRLSTAGEGFTTGPAWSPNGQVLAYTVQTGRGYNSSWTLVLDSFESGQERKLPLSVTHDRSLEPVWALDGKSLLVAARARGKGDGLFRIDPQTGLATTLALTGTPVHSLAWSPEGDTVFYVVGKHDDRRLRKRDLETGEEEELLSGTYFQRLVLSPDGDCLAIAFEHAIRLLSMEDNSFREVLHIPEKIGNIAWSNRGSHLFFVRVGDASQSLWSVDISGGQATDVGLTMDGLGLVGQWGLSPHPDGRSLVFHASGATVNEVWRLDNLPWASRRPSSGSDQ